jgi:putative NADH-flavin reductase
VKVLVFGTADHTSRAVVGAALAAGHAVTAVFPTGTSVTPHERLEVVHGDATDQSLVDSLVPGSDAVLSVVGVGHRGPTTLYSEAAANIVQALDGAEGAGTRRVVCVSSARVDADGPGLSGPRRIYTKLIIHRRYRNPLNDMERMENELRRSDLDWTVVRPATLRPGPAGSGYRSTVNGHVPNGSALTTGDLGHYLAAALDDPATYRAVVELAA